MKMKITILEDSVIESERLKNGIRKYGQQYDWDIEIDEYESGEEYFSKNSEGTTIQASAFFLDIQMGRIKTVCIMFLPRLAMAVEGSMHRRTIRRLRCAK